MIRAAVLGGLVTGVLSALPVVSAVNLCCCLWVVTGGVVAAYVLQQKEAVPLTMGDGALVGFLAGILGAVVFLVAAIPITLVLAPVQQEAIERLIESGTVPPEIRDYLVEYTGGLLGIAVQFFTMLAAGMVFSTVGGLLGVLWFRRPGPPPPGTIDVTPAVPR